MAKGCHNSPAAKGWILTSPCLWSCDQQHLGDVAEVADTSFHAMSCNVTLRYVMLCYLIWYPWDSNHQYKTMGVNKIPPWINLPKGFNHRIWVMAPLAPPPRSSLVHAAGHGRWAVRPGVMHQWTWRWINICKAPLNEGGVKQILDHGWSLLKPGDFWRLLYFFFFFGKLQESTMEIWVEIQK